MQMAFVSAIGYMIGLSGFSESVCAVWNGVGRTELTSAGFIDGLNCI